MDWGAVVFSYLTGVTVRTLGLVVLAWAGIGLLRVKTAGARHAVWTVTAAGMLLLAALATLMPPLAVPLLRASAPVEVAAIPDGALPLSGAPAGAIAPAPSIHRPAVTWQRAVVAIYLAGVVVFLLRLVFSYLFTARLVHASRAVREVWAGDVYESDWISVPLTIGWLRPRVLLPAGWQSWDRAKLHAVLVHERTHVERGDWAISLMAGLNRCVFWFHPAAWWLERELATLAEQACDDAALLQVDARENYAQALLDMAAAVKRGEGRLMWEAMAMAKASEVKMRIERILDETRQIPRGVTRLRWALLVACSLPLIYVASVAQLVPAQAQEQQQTAGAAAQQPDFAQMEQFVAAHPDDLEARSKLVRDYYLYSIKQPRLNHIFWMIQNHPESDLTSLNSVGISPRTTALNDEKDYQTAAGLWRQQVAVHGGDAHVLANAARFFGQAGADADEAERLLMAARSLDSRNNAYTQQLGRLYVQAILASSGDPLYPAASANPGFAAKASSELEASSDGSLLSYAGNQLAAAGRTQSPYGSAPLDVNAHPALVSIVDLGNRLVARSQSINRSQLPPGAVVRMGPPPPPTPEGFVNQARAQALAGPPLVPAPAVVHQVAPPVSPFGGDVHLIVTIGTDGRVTDASVENGLPMLATDAVNTVKQWTFTPVLQKGVPTVVRARVVMPFRLEGHTSTLDAATAEPKPPQPSLIRVGGNVQRAKLQHEVAPVYPQAAKDAGISGTVELQILISKEGTVASTTVIDGHPLLAAAAQQAVMQWVYSPTLLNGDPVQVSTTVSVPFPLQ